MLTLFNLLFLSSAFAGGLIYQGATATLSGTPSLVTYQTRVSLRTTPQMVLTSSVEDPTPRNVNIAPSPDDSGYVNGVYTCASEGTYSVGASLSVAGTLAVNSTVTMTISVSNDGTTWTNLRTTGQGPTTGLGKTYGYVPFLVPCVAGGKIRVLASVQNLVLPTVSSSLDENTLTITKIF